ncbi:MAG: AAA family ATPase [Thermomicrobiales bacterium]
MPIPDASHEDVLAAMARFDAELRGAEAWRGWETRGNFRFAIEHEGRRYPVKHIVADATGVGTHEFSGGDEANRWLQHRDFEIVDLRQMPAKWWWVNQGASYEQDSRDGILWAAKRNVQGREFHYWTNVSKLAVGDGILHYVSGAIRAIGIVRSSAIDAPRPNGPLHGTPEGQGFLVRVAYHQLTTPIQREDIPADWRYEGDGPFDRSGGIKQGYLFPLQRAFVSKLAKTYASRLPSSACDWSTLAGATDTEEIAQIRGALERMYPDELSRVACLNLLADSIHIAHAVSPNSWSVRLRDASSLRLNVSWAQACVLGPDNIYLVLDADVLTPEMEQEIGAVEIDGPSRGQVYASMPFARGAHFLASQLDALQPLIAPAHTSLVERSARQVRTRSNYHLKHQPEIVDYLRAALGRDVPQPAYVKHGGDTEGYKEPSFPDILAAIAAQGMRLDPRTVRRYHTALKTRGFVVLSGPSGTGKTWLAEAYANAAGARHAVVAVAPNWTTNEDLLGYHNPLTGQYHDTIFSHFVREAGMAYRAAQEVGVEPRPYHLVLDEMNLARVEYYFAQFLSAMEVRARHGTAELALGIEEPLLLPPNLFVIGTVNVDETTHAFADKVHDRAQLIELGVRREDLSAHAGKAAHAADLMAMWDAVQHAGLFTFRVLDEVQSYIDEAVATGASWEEALDEQFLQKVLPKLKGADLRVGAALAKVVALTADRYPLTHAKAARMLADFHTHNFASYFG